MIRTKSYWKEPFYCFGVFLNTRIFIFCDSQECQVGDTNLGPVSNNFWSCDDEPFFRVDSAKFAISATHRTTRSHD
jgi:hypothetical protein